MQARKQHAVLALQQHITCTSATLQLPHCSESPSVVHMGLTSRLHQCASIREVGAHLWQSCIGKRGVQQHDPSRDTTQGLDVGQP